MYYKVINKESKVYQELKSLRETELQIEEYNKKAIQEKIGNLKYQTFFGIGGQQNFMRVSQYTGFRFTNNPDEIDKKVWVLDSKGEELYLPNKRTKAGREMQEFLLNGLKKSFYSKPLDILNVTKDASKFIFPYILVCGEVIIIFLDDIHQPNDENVIEITSKEFNSIFNSNF